MTQLKIVLFYLFLFIKGYVNSQNIYTINDSSRGGLTNERIWWDVQKYSLKILPNYKTKTITGSNEIKFKVLKIGTKMQIDLQEPMKIDSICYDFEKLDFERFNNVYYVLFDSNQVINSTSKIEIYFSGKPREALNAPWDGGWIWSKDKLNRPWMSVACQGLGASVWYPCKDHQGDEPDLGALISITTEDSLIGISNGRLISHDTYEHKNTFVWEVKNPINNYNIVPYIGYYKNWNEKYIGEKGELDCQYWVLDYELENAKRQFIQCKSLLKIFEYWFAPYPFYEDGYKIVQAPFLGMEHQSAIAYGNKFKNGYLGRDLSSTGIGLKWDFILVHESGHEWFGNSITSNDIADMWIHESFTNYSETLYTTSIYGVRKGNKYVQGTRKLIQNDEPIISNYGVNSEGSGDMYYKGANMLHIIRQFIDDDEKFRAILRLMNKEFYHQTVTTSQIEDFWIKQSGLDLQPIFDQYLRNINIPILEVKHSKGKTFVKWSNCILGFNLALKLKNGRIIEPKTEWITIKKGLFRLKIDPNFYILVKEIEN
jgi:aminopeptidase N